MSDFFYMGGYGFYVWWSFGMTVVLMAGELVLVSQQRLSVLKRLKRLMRLDTNQYSNQSINADSNNATAQISNSEA